MPGPTATMSEKLPNFEVYFEGKKISLAQDIQGCIFLSRNASDTGYLTMDTRN